MFLWKFNMIFLPFIALLFVKFIPVAPPYVHFAVPFKRNTVTRNANNFFN